MKKMKSIKIVETKDDKENNKSPNDIKIIEETDNNDENGVNVFSKNEDNVINNTFNSVLLKRTISGIQAMFSTLEAMSSQYQPDISATDVLSDIKISKGKFSKFEHDLEGLEIEFGDYAEQTDTRIAVTEEQVSINVQDINTLQRQVSGEMETYTGDEQPLPSNSPANSWNDAEKARRIGTKYYCTDGTSWQWMSGMLAYGSNALIY
jgi:hypothetical protein